MVPVRFLLYGNASPMVSFFSWETNEIMRRILVGLFTTSYTLESRSSTHNASILSVEDHDDDDDDDQERETLKHKHTNTS